MSTETQTSRVEIPDPIPESSGRNPQGYGVGVSSDAAIQEDPCQRSHDMMEAVVERGNMLRAYKQVVSNKGAAGVDGMTVDELMPFPWLCVRQ